MQFIFAKQLHVCRYILSQQPLNDYVTNIIQIRFTYISGVVHISAKITISHKRQQHMWFVLCDDDAVQTQHIRVFEVLHDGRFFKEFAQLFRIFRIICWFETRLNECTWIRFRSCISEVNLTQRIQKTPEHIHVHAITSDFWGFFVVNISYTPLNI